MPVTLENAGTVQGLQVQRALLTNDRGLELGVLSFGGTLQYLSVPQGSERVQLALGFDAPSDYAIREGSLGATVGRFANRIAHGRCRLDDRELDLPRNEGGRHHLHGGGVLGFSHKHWTIEIDSAANAAHLRLLSPDGDAGYPGTCRIGCTYSLDDADVVRIDIEATCDAPTPINIANHAYWNLAGEGAINHHELKLWSDRYVEVDAEGIPSGRILPVSGTAFDFQTIRPLDHAGPPNLDHCFVVSGEGLRPVALLRDPASKRSLEVWADQPGVQVYAGLMLDVPGRGGSHYGARSGFCLETERFPDAPNHPEFPDAILRPGEIYRHRMEWRFSYSG
ncbi:aldose 1-epimerase [Arboricoccus pini]|uniref:Aldose 1-epimerase n=1 Tax=Arboricoccus pini TaxID=1963835 RepID=A0A212Q5X2_9PROT|nr:aldose epimerase family protein [Arboricoccus pini]SNB54637.1 aldose 1-epimerase [Arboricoccus pini]